MTTNLELEKYANIDLSDFRNEKLLKEFCDKLDFKGLSIIATLRKVLTYIKLPAEAQRIDRIMKEISVRFHSCNPSVYANSDTAYILMFSLIMLNTDLHNPRITKKLTKSQFIKNVKGIDNGNDLPRDHLEELYDNIRLHEIRLNAQA